MKIIANISRILVGLVFIFSGFVKGVDPLGTAYRIEDYFMAFGTDWAIPLALFLSIFLCAVEFTLGVTMLLNIRMKDHGLAVAADDGLFYRAHPERCHL